MLRANVEYGPIAWRWHKNARNFEKLDEFDLIKCHKKC